MQKIRHGKPIGFWLCIIFILPFAAFAQNKFETPKSIHKGKGAPSAARKKVELPSTPEPMPGPIEAEADRMEYDRENEKLFLQGNVEIRRPPWIIYAPELDIDLKTNLAVAGKGVRIVRMEEYQEQEVIVADSAEINIESQTGLLAKGKLVLPMDKGQIRIEGERLERVSENQYLFKTGSFTSCQCAEGKKPDWEIKAKEINADTKGSAKMKSVQVLVREKSILYLPYAQYPVTTDRKSGFLSPSFGYSSKYGYKAGLPYYQVLGPSADTTLYPYWLSDRGFFVGDEFRHNLGNISMGDLEGFAIDDSQEHRWRWSGNYSGESDWKTGWLREDVNMLSDNEYLLDFDQNLAYRWQRELDSAILYSQNLPGSNLSAEVKRFDDIAGWDLRPVQGWRPDTDEQQTWLLPQISHQVFNRPIAGPVGFDMLSGFDYYYREDQSLGRGAELALAPRITYTPFSTPGVRVQAYAGYQGTLLYPEPAFSESVSFITNPEAGARIGLNLEKVFGETADSQVKYRHLFQPEIVVDYRGKGDEPEDRFFRELNPLPETGLAGIRLHNLIFQKQLDSKEPAANLVSEFEINQFYDWVQGQFVDLELKGYVQNPNKYGLISDDYYNFREGELHRAQVQAWVMDSRADRFWIGYLFARGKVLSSWYQFPQMENENWTGGTSIKLGNDLNASYQLAYSQKYSTVVSQSLRMDYTARQKCWAVNLMFGEHINPETPGHAPIYSYSMNFQLLSGTHVQLGPEWSDVLTRELGPGPGPQ